ncbi:GNAT family N-acetyltransferase [Priestia megaterium]|uniref:GNAT family N-acetyltransferase n=1 Tax=Priestia megaterium TaxID=1404 RepID=UPI002453533E|nr:GNAT family N-acetyltransferase [Priestia megaterium]MDH3141364.1 GNAT family N-acetyltransferase [Priestia megaterium]MED4237496.1 GNAT family N-acetyltransferase [Priestia megaterium]MED4266568.1 GNAT family N-acetyltransferase [Priestia megaterium]MED4275890.1 GNAT family N-acetyltransferase [Priestia megaterium]MED4314798.1 GNAT family N-acetyltransferase [Priestia megaterium]
MKGNVPMIIRQVDEKDLNQLITLENKGFTPEEAASKDAFITRINTIPDTFIIAQENEEIIGYVNGPVISAPFITDDLFEKTISNPETGGHQSILGIVVNPKHHHKGIASKLLREFEKQARNKQRLTVTLTCKEELIPFYEKNGYVNQGVAESQHAGVQWFNMSKEL